MCSGRDINLPFSEKLISICGVTVDDNQVSTKAKFLRNKDIGVGR
jgi:hypothetical protein